MGAAPEHGDGRTTAPSVGSTIRVRYAPHSRISRSIDWDGRPAFTPGGFVSPPFWAGGGALPRELRPPASGRDSLTIRWLVDTRIRFVVVRKGPSGPGRRLRPGIHLTRAFPEVEVKGPSGLGADAKQGGLVAYSTHSFTPRRRESQRCQNLRTNPLDWKRPTGRTPRRETPGRAPGPGVARNRQA